jgi:DNA-binding SARP family transcriptional activator
MRQERSLVERDFGIGGETTTRRGLPAPALAEHCVGPLFEAFPYGLALIDRDRRVLKLNGRARTILLVDEARTPGRWTCCELVCRQVAPLLGIDCLSRHALGCGGDLPEVRVDLHGEHLQTSAWITASFLGCAGPVLFHLRPGRPGDRRRRTRQGWHGDSSGGLRADLRMTTLGPFTIEATGTPLGGEWTGRRPGQLLKFLVSRRRRLLMPDEIVEALWPNVGHEEAKNRLRFQIHTLREHLDPDRAPHGDSRFLRSRHGGYIFDTSVAWVDADEFEREANAGLAALRQGDRKAAAPHLCRAGALYRGPFIADDPYAEWVLEERERLRELAVLVLQSHAEILVGQGDLDGAMPVARRLAETEPYDSDVQRFFLELILARGRRGEAVRRYDLYRVRLRKSFDSDPDFELRDLKPALARPHVKR